MTTMVIEPSDEWVRNKMSIQLPASIEMTDAEFKYDSPDEISGDPVLAGFVLDLRKTWDLGI